MEEKMQEKREFYRVLKGMKVWIPCQKRDDQITLQLLVNGQGDQVIPAFCSKRSPKGNFTEECLLEIAFSMLRNVLIEMPEDIKGIAIEPFDRNIVLDRAALAEYDSYTQGMTVEQHHHQQGTIYRGAGELPSGLQQAIRRFLRDRIGVNAAWALLAQNENERIPHLTFALDYFGSKFDLFPQLAEVIKPFMRPGQSFELIDRNAQMAPALTEEACIYRRTGTIQ